MFINLGYRVLNTIYIAPKNFLFMKRLLILIALVSFFACDNSVINDDIKPVPAEEAVNNNSEAIIIESNDDGLNQKSMHNAAIKSSFVVTTQNGTVWEQNNLEIQNNSKDAVSYEWDFGNGETSTDMNPEFSYLLHGDYTITLKVTDEKGYTDVSTQDVTVLCIFGGGSHSE